MNRFCIVLTLTATALNLMGQNKEKIDKYVNLGDTWLSDRLQMHWNTHATQQYMNGEYYDHCAGDSANVPTIQINGARNHATVYQRPKLEELSARQEDPRGMYLRNNNLPGHPYEWASIKQTGNIVGSINIEICGLALDAAKLWKETGKDKYAQSSYSVLYTYMMGILNSKMPIDMNHGHMQTLYGLQTHEVIHDETLPKLTETYRMLKPWILASKASDIDRLDAAFKHWADIIIMNGVPHNNWDLIQAKFIFNVGQVLKSNDNYQDKKGREYYFDIVETEQSIRQWSLKTLAEYGYDPANGIWCECAGYSQGVLGDYAEFVRLFKEETGKDLLVSIPVIAKAARNNVEYLFPDSMTIGFGDTHPSRINRATYQKLNMDLDTLHPSSTFAAPKTSWLVQRNGMNRMNSLAFAINGSEGNHMHANGPSLELYGRGLRLGPDAGIGYSLYGGDDYKEWYSQFPSHNTVCVDGISTYATMMSSHPFEIISNVSPQKLTEKASYQYSEVYMFEPESRSDQQRLVILVTTGEQTGYFVDVFRSRRQDGKDKTHDYFYHNLGQTMDILDAEHKASLEMEPTQELAFAGGHLYAYSYIYDKMRCETSLDLKAEYVVTPDSSYMTDRAKTLWADGKITMTQWMKGEANRAIFKCLCPTTEGLSRVPDMPYDIRKQPTLSFVARQYGEAWDHPFVSVFEPSSEANPGTIAHVSYPEVVILNHSAKSATALLVEHNDGSRQLIISCDNPKARVKVMGKKYAGQVVIKNL